jgi:hypothetical protein
MKTKHQYDSDNDLIAGWFVTFTLIVAAIIIAIGIKIAGTW